MWRHTGSGLEEEMATVGRNQQGYGAFLLALKNSLTIENIRMLMTALDFKPAERDKVERSEDHGQFFIHSLREKGIINEKDVSTLTDKLKLCGLHGVAFEVIKSFTRYQSSTRLQRSNLGNNEGSCLLCCMIYTSINLGLSRRRHLPKASSNAHVQYLRVWPVRFSTLR
ncbi:hypothetical protein HOLleu_00563 [Holothuria leucospilota]|uniref:Uncharacterized protein n=1 Tax=Holothuria leucospilota TaxID=206669 RepID=A0A9Q1CPU7_HOLLE|nr:hypothetical protein HOLleu_00563 [Holothuria leucospilota]